ncbi:MAG: ABC-type amino acid transport substrate-binding protein, partial [Chlamydiales bacterium]
MKNRIFGGMIFALITGILLLILPKENESEDVLLVGTNAEFPPFTYVYKEHYVGFDIDLSKEICKRLGKKMQIRDLPFDSLVPSAMLGKVDFIAAGVTHTKERAERVLFTQPYLSGDPLVMVSMKGEAPLLSTDDLLGKAVVVNEGYTADLFLTEKEGLDLIRLGSQPAEGFMSLMSGRCDVFVTATSTLNPIMHTDQSKRFQFAAINESSDNYAIIVPKKKAHLLGEIQAVLDSMEKDGSLQVMKKA